jgi:excisionase family DNA binding protein
MDKYLTVRQVAEQLQVSMASVYQMCSGGQLPHLRVGLKRGTIRIREQDLAAFIENSKAQTSAARR